MKKFIVRLLCVPFIPLIALMAMNKPCSNGSTNGGFWWCVKEFWKQWWKD